MVILLILFQNKIVVENPYLLIVKFDDEFADAKIETILASNSKKYMLKSKTILHDEETEVTYEVRMKGNDAQLVSEISAVAGVSSSVMLSYDGNFTA